jgi:glutathionylspermidine synthase
MLVSNKALLPLLWQRYPGHPNLLEAHFAGDKTPTTGNWVKKPLLAREGANITKLVSGQVIPVTGSDFHQEYDNGYVYQQWFELPIFDGFRPIIGSWIVGGKTAGIGIREDKNDVTGNDSHFVPHYFN